MKGWGWLLMIGLKEPQDKGGNFVNYLLDGTLSVASRFCFLFTKMQIYGII